MFQAVIREPDICAELVERLLHIKVKKIDYLELEKQIAPYYTTKGVRLDVYLKDEDKIIDVEMQSYPMDSLGKRTRYYQSMIDMDSLMKGQDYSELKDSYILFICKYDPFKDTNEHKFGLPCYTFRNLCRENNTVNLNDKSIKVIYNASAYVAMNLHDRDICRAAKQEGKNEKAIEAAKNAIDLGLSVDQISKIISLPVEQVLELQKHLTATV